MELFLDIETIARPGAEVLLPEPCAPANYKDPAKIAQYIAEKRAAQQEKMALDKRTCEIVTIGISAGNLTSDAMDVSEPAFGNSERELLTGFWAFVADLGIHEPIQLVGFNVIGFDLPILMRRSCLLGVTPTVKWTPRKYQHDSVLDLMQEWVGWDGYASLKDVCRECGIPEPEGDGADVATMTPEQRIAHCKSDVEATRALYNKGKGYYW
jgi:hypothetical protein